MASENPALLYGIEGKGQIHLGFDADLVLVDLEEQWTVERSMVQSKCGWSPFEGETFWGLPRWTVLRGQVAMREGLPVGTPDGKVARFTG
jgi:dihydroorotase